MCARIGLPGPEQPGICPGAAPSGACLGGSGHRGAASLRVRGSDWGGGTAHGCAATMSVRFRVPNRGNSTGGCHAVAAVGNNGATGHSAQFLVRSSLFAVLCSQFFVRSSLLHRGTISMLQYAPTAQNSRQPWQAFAGVCAWVFSLCVSRTRMVARFAPSGKRCFQEVCGAG